MQENLSPQAEQQSQTPVLFELFARGFLKTLHLSSKTPLYANAYKLIEILTFKPANFDETPNNQQRRIEEYIGKGTDSIIQYYEEQITSLVQKGDPQELRDDQGFSYLDLRIQIERLKQARNVLKFLHEEGVIRVQQDNLSECHILAQTRLSPKQQEDMLRMLPGTQPTLLENLEPIIRPLFVSARLKKARCNGFALLAYAKLRELGIKENSVCFAGIFLNVELSLRLSGKRQLNILENLLVIGNIPCQGTQSFDSYCATLKWNPQSLFNKNAVAFDRNAIVFDPFDGRIESLQSYRINLYPIAARCSATETINPTEKRAPTLREALGDTPDAPETIVALLPRPENKALSSLTFSSDLLRFLFISRTPVTLTRVEQKGPTAPPTPRRY